MDRPRHLLHVFSTFAAAGPQLRAVRLMAAFGAMYRHSLVSLDGDTSAAEHAGKDVAIRIVPPPRKAGSARTAGALRRVLAAEAPDLVLTYNWAAVDMVLAAQTLGLTRVVHHEDGFNADEATRRKTRRNLARRLLLPQTARVIVPSRTLHRIAIDEWKLSPDHLALIPNGIAVGECRPMDGHEALRTELGISPGSVVIGAVGHLRSEKNLDRLVDAFRMLDTSAELLIVGDGPERARLEAVVDQSGVGARTRFVGHQRDLAGWWRLVDVVAISSDTEQLPMTLLEAMAHGLPVVATDVGDIRHVLPDEQSIFLVSHRAPDAARLLATHLASLIADPSLRRRLGSANREHVATHFTFDAMRAAYEAVYEEALAGPGRTRR